MSVKVQRLRVLVNERLTAAAEEIFALFERTIVEYEEEMCRSKEENKRKQQLLDSGLKGQVLLHRTDVLKNEEESGPSLNQENSLCVQEEQQEPSKKTEIAEFSFIPDTENYNVDLFQLLQQKQIKENREDCGGVGPLFDPHGYLRSQTQEQTQELTDNSSVTDNDDNWGPPTSGSAQQKETKADGDDTNPVQSNNPDRRSQETLNRELSVCGVRRKMIRKHASGNGGLQRHVRSHTGDKPFSCSVCNRCFTRKSSLKIHMVFHMKEKPFSCSECDLRFTQMLSLVVHMRTVHRKEKPFNSMDITIQRGDFLPELKRCSECCSKFHCPFCAPKCFQPTNLSKVQKHLKGHFNRSIEHEGFTIHQCGLLCRMQYHYHCPFCNSTILRKTDFITHLKTCNWKSRPLSEATTASASAAPKDSVSNQIEFQDMTMC